MLINRDSLIRSLEASPVSHQFGGLVETLKAHKLQDLLLTNVLLEAQTFKVLPYALTSVSSKSEMDAEDLPGTLMAWVITVSDGIKDASHHPMDSPTDDLDAKFFARMRQGEPSPAVAADVVDSLLDDVCKQSRNSATEEEKLIQKPTRKNVFYTFCRMLDNAMLTHQPNLGLDPRAQVSH